MSEKKKKRKKLKPLHVFAYLVMTVQVVFFLALTAPNLFGYRSYAVAADTMKPAIVTGDVIYVRNSDPSLLEENDIICFYPDDSLIPMTRRVVRNDLMNRSLEIKGDNEDSSVRIPYSYYSGKVYYHLPLLGYLGKFLSTTYGKVIYMLLMDAMILLIWLF
ncbi:MAG: S24/S26 family peptidase [Erysipelotrichaceae bacterium]|nr:S24/S26 family peptidase [Erysipelotrichaceae bacterium]